MHIKFEYLYRDAGNNKIWGEIVFSNLNQYDLESLKTMITKNLIENEFFIAKTSKLPPLRFEKIDGELDHDYYEFASISETTEQVNDSLNRDITEFIDTLSKPQKIQSA